MSLLLLALTIAIFILGKEVSWLTVYQTDVIVRFIAAYLIIFFFSFSMEKVRDTVHGRLEASNLELRVEITERKRVEEALKQSEEKYRTILENIEDGYYEVDLTGNLTFFNDSLCRMLGYSKDELISMGNQQYTDQENRKKLFEAFNRVYRTGEPTKEFDWEVIRKDGAKVFGEVSVSLIKDSKGQPIGFRGIARDITERKCAEEEREKLIRDLQGVLSKVKTLSGMLPICASCKKIRDDKGYWNQIEAYIRDHSEAEFSHGICPECIKKLYPDLVN
jgi:PAS domain S-box-containing protein